MAKSGYTVENSRLLYQIALLADAVLATELVNPSTRIDDFLLACIERMTGRANLNDEVFTQCRPCGEFVATTTGHFDVAVIGMDLGFHFRSSLRQKRWKKGA